MADEHPPKPVRVKVTKAWLAEQEAKQQAYAAKRRSYLGLEPAGASQGAPGDETGDMPRSASLTPLAGRKRRAKEPDRRQLGFDLE